MPLLVLWGAHGAIGEKDALAIWRAWAEDIRGGPLPGGHFQPEEQADMVAEQFARFFQE